MSRYYRVMVEIKSKITQNALNKIMSCDFGWEETGSNEYEGTKYFEGEGNLHGYEEEAHKEIKAAILKKDKKAKVKTTWTYLEDLPNSTYGKL
jgi:hypothetical protein